MNGKQKYIPEKIVNEYVQIDQQIKKLTAERGELREKVLDAFHKGYKCSPRGPYILKLTPVHSERRQIDWKEYACDLLLKIYGKVWEHELQIFEESNPVVVSDSERLDMKINPEFKG